MRYCVGQGVLADSFLDISADEFESLKAAKRKLLVLLGIEEKLEMVIYNFVEYERTLLELALSDMVSRVGGATFFYDARSLVSRRLANCLTLGRSYEDQVLHDLSSAYGRSADIRARLIDAFAAQSRQLLGFRGMRAVRNCLQHRSLVLKELVFRGGWEEHGEASLRHHHLGVKLDVEALRDDRKISSQEVIKELERNPAAHDLTLLLREYVEALSGVHQELWTLTQDDVKEWKHVLREILERYSQAHGKEARIVVAFRHDGEVTLEEVYVVADVIDRFEQARTRQLPIRISQAYVSNCPLEER